MYFSCLDALLFLAKNFTMGSWFSLLHYVKFVAPETDLNSWNEIVKYPYKYLTWNKTHPRARSMKLS